MWPLLTETLETRLLGGGCDFFQLLDIGSSFLVNE